jgi:hypothetical protein
MVRTGDDHPHLGGTTVPVGAMKIVLVVPRSQTPSPPNSKLLKTLALTQIQDPEEFGEGVFDSLLLIE